MLELWACMRWRLNCKSQQCFTRQRQRFPQTKNRLFLMEQVVSFFSQLLQFQAQQFLPPFLFQMMALLIALLYPCYPRSLACFIRNCSVYDVGLHFENACHGFRAPLESIVLDDSIVRLPGVVFRLSHCTILNDLIQANPRSWGMLPWQQEQQKISRES